MFGLNKNQILLIVLILGLSANTVIHFTHPAYKSYRSKSRDLDIRYENFVRKVQTDFIPAITLSITSRVDHSTVVYSNSFSSVSSVQSVASSPVTLPCSFGVDRGRPFVYFRNRVFYVSDDFFGFPILDIRPTVFFTSAQMYIIGGLPSSSHSISNQVSKL